MPASPPNPRDLFFDALDLPPDAWLAFLDERCGPDPAVRARVDALLRAHQEASSRAADPAETAGYPAAADPAGADAVIGPYTLREVVGEGGMGVVYVADQTEPVRRRVALKVVKPGMDSREVVARFEQERQALALMDHPHIARVFDGGATTQGRPYFVMELVRGLPVTDYCDQAILSAAHRLKLFAQVCRAVQHAHQKGVIHRDLKPSNVLVTVIDGQPVPKVIDFGIAKATSGGLTDRTVYTRFAQLVGTPLYMSPEQADLSGVDVDTRADVYSLGVVLYELLTGTTPFAAEAMRDAGFDELRRMIREDEPARPSHRVSTLDARAGTTLSARRGVDRRQLGRLLRGDLDWIVMTALEKDRNRRYESAGAFAADVDRFLADQPVHARPPSAAYRARKFARRNRAALAMAVVLAVAGLAVVGAVGWGLRDAAARQAAADHDAAARRAGAEQAATAALGESADHFREDRPDAAMTAARRAVDVLTGVPGTDAATAAAQGRVADLAFAAWLEDRWLEGVPFRHSEGSRSGAFRDYRLDPTELPEPVLTERVRSSFIVRELVLAFDGWAAARRTYVDPADPLAAKLQAVAAAADPDPVNRRVRDALLDGAVVKLAAVAADLPDDAEPATMARLAWALGNAGRRADAEALLRRAVRLHPGSVRPAFDLATLLISSPSVPSRTEAVGFYRVALALRPHSVYIMGRLGAVLTDFLDRPAEGADLIRQAIRLRPNDPILRENLSVALGKQGKPAEALAVAREAVAVAPSATTHHRLGVVLRQAGRRAEAEEAYRAAVRCEPQTASDHEGRGLALQNLGRLPEAIVELRNAARLQPERSIHHHNLGYALEQSGAADEALAAYRTALQVRPDHTQTRLNLGALLRRTGRAEEALAEYQAAARDRPDDPVTRHLLGLTLDHLDRREEALAEFREAVRLKPDYARAHFALGHLLNRLDRSAEAMAAYTQAVRHQPVYPQAHCNLASLYLKTGRYADALEHFRRGHGQGIKTRNWAYPSAEWLANAERVVALGPRLPAILAGADLPSEAADAAAVAVAASLQKRHLRAAELYRSALAADPALARRVGLSRRFSAACAAARAGTGQGEAADTLDASDRAKWRRQALAWLRADLSSWETELATGTPAARRQVQDKLAGWQTDDDLAGVRGTAALAKLPDAERAEWGQFWADVRAVLGQARPAAKK